MLSPLDRLRRELGIPVRTAMNSDVNGFSWALSDMLRAAGIGGLIMSINEHFGRAPQPFPGLLRWRTPSGGGLPVWNGRTYAHTAWLGIGGDPAAVFPRLQEFIARRRRQGWTHPWLHMQFTHPGPQNDNMGPLAHLGPWVAAFNKRHGDAIRLVITTPTRFFDTIAPAVAGAPLCRGEWNDWWSFGVGSTLFETALFRRASARLEEADLLALIDRRRNHGGRRASARDSLAHYIEHTWGADTSVHWPDDEDTRIQQRHKEQFAYNGFSATRMLRRDGLGALAERIAAPAGPGVVVYNPTPHPRRETIGVARRLLEATRLQPARHEPDFEPRRWPRDGAYQHFVDRNLFGGALIEEVGPLDLTPFGWRVVTAADRASRAPGLVFSGRSISNGRLSLHWTGDVFGLGAVASGNRQWCEAPASGFGTIIAEDILGGDRGTIMRFDDGAGAVETRRPFWNPTAPVSRMPARLTGCRVERETRSLRLIQEGELPHTDGVSITWKISAEHDDLEAVILIRKRAEVRPHSLYLSLPFGLPDARPWVDTAGLVVEADDEVLPNACPWWSVQGGFALSGADGTFAVGTPDTPMIIFRRLPLGASQVDGASLGGDGTALLWLYNNYWETNFKADDDGLWRFRVRIAWSPRMPALPLLRRTAALARHPLATHPLPEAGGPEPSWPPTGTLLETTARHSRIEVCRPEGGADAWRLVLSNPGTEPDEFVWTDGPLHVRAAVQVDPEGRELAPLAVRSGSWRITLPARSTAHVSIRFSTTNGGAA